MTIPETVPQVIFFVVLVVPGIAFITTRDAVLGPRSNLTVAGRVLEALFISVIFDTVYLVAAGGFYAMLSRSNFAIVINHLGVAGLIALLLFLIVPCVISFFAYGVRVDYIVTDGKRARQLRYRHTYVNVPSAWDKVAGSFDVSQFVRVRLEDGTWVGGWFSTRSFVSTFPQPRDIFIEDEWEMSPNGEFVSSLSASTGVWLAITDQRIVEWVSAEAATNDTEIPNG